MASSPSERIYLFRGAILTVLWVHCLIPLSSPYTEQLGLATISRSEDPVKDLLLRRLPTFLHCLPYFASDASDMEGTRRTPRD